MTVSTVEPVMPLEAGGDRGRARAPRRWPAPRRVIVATEVVADAQVTWLVRFSVELSEKRAGGGELLGSPVGDARVGRRHGDRLEGRRRR